MADDGVRSERPLPVDADGVVVVVVVPESTDGDGGLKRGGLLVSDCGAREGEVAEGMTEEAAQRKTRVQYISITLKKLLISTRNC